MPRGRVPKPTVKHILEGTFRPDRHNGNEPQPAAGIPKCPRHLSKLAKECWRELVDVLGDAGILTQADRNVMALYCEAYADWRAAKELLAETGPVLIDDDSGRAYKSPTRVVLNEAVAQMQSLGASLGLDPVSRTRLRALPQPPAPNNKARFFKAREESA